MLQGGYHRAVSLDPPSSSDQSVKSVEQCRATSAVTPLERIVGLLYEAVALIEAALRAPPLYGVAQVFERGPRLLVHVGLS